MLAERERARPRGHGGNAGGWRRQSRHQRTRRRSRGLPLRAGGHGYGGALRALGRLALRHRLAGEERHRRRYRRRISGQRRLWNVCAAARRRGQQREGTIGGEISVAAAGYGSVGIATGRLIENANQVGAPARPINQKRQIMSEDAMTMHSIAAGEIREEAHASWVPM